MIDHYICAVPESVWSQGRPPNTCVWEASFNLMAWVNASHATGGIELMMQHSDAAGDHYTRVDAVQGSGPKTHLLSSQIRLRFCGKVTAVRVILRLTNGNMLYRLDELWIQPQGLSQPPRKLLERANRPAASNDSSHAATRCGYAPPAQANGGC